MDILHTEVTLVYWSHALINVKQVNPYKYPIHRSETGLLVTCSLKEVTGKSL